MRSNATKLPKANKRSASTRQTGDAPQRSKAVTTIDPKARNLNQDSNYIPKAPSTSDVAALMDFSRDLVVNLHSFGRGATLCFHGGGPHFGLTVWLGTKNIGYLDTADLNDLLGQAVSRAAFMNFLPMFRCYLETAQKRLNDGPDGWTQGLEPSVGGVRRGLFEVNGGREKG
jgi:hypothetical protein